MIPSSMRMMVRFEFDSVSLARSSGVVKASEGFELAICLAISRGVLRGLVVVITAPKDMTERQTMGKKMEFGESKRMTWPLRIPMS